MRVLHIFSGNLYGGVETLLLTLARYYRLCPAMEPHFAVCLEGRLREELDAVGARIHLLGNVRVRWPLSVWRSRRVLKDALRQQKINIVICHSAWPQAIFGPVVRSARLPLVFWLHDAADGHHWLQLWARRTRPDLALCCSRYTQSTLREMYPKVSSQLIRCPISPSSWSACETELQATRAEFNTSMQATVILQTSRMEAWKGHGLLLQALALLRDLPNWIAWIVGGAQRPRELSYLNSLKKAAVTLGIANRVMFLGQRSDVPRILAAADIHCQPNTGPEPFGIRLSRRSTLVFPSSRQRWEALRRSWTIPVEY